MSIHIAAKKGEIAETILLHKGEISIGVIKGIPFLQDKNEAAPIINFLKNKYNVEIYHKRITSSRLPYWEEIIRLKTN